jgi:hypothetical protein
MKLEFSQQVFEKSSNIKFYKNPSSGSRVVPCRQTDVQTDMIKLIAVFRNSMNTPENHVTMYLPELFICVRKNDVRL